jgi:predicted NodU family carbamoyl transferase
MSTPSVEREVIAIPGQPDVLIESGKVVNANQLRVYWRERHHQQYRSQALERALHPAEPEPDIEPPKVTHIVAYEYSDLTERNLQRIGKIEMDIRQLQEKKPVTKKSKIIKGNQHGIEL